MTTITFYCIDVKVVWENMRTLKDGEAVSVDGTHLVRLHPDKPQTVTNILTYCSLNFALRSQGHNIPDSKGNRYCINLVSVAGLPADEQEKK